MKYAIFLLFALTLACLWHSASLSEPLRVEMRGISEDYAGKRISESAKNEKIAVAFIKSVGENWLWHLAPFTFFIAATSLAYATNSQAWVRYCLAGLTAFVFALATSVFLLADESVELLEKVTYANLFEDIFKIKLGSVLLGLIAGGILFEMIKPILLPNPPKASAHKQNITRAL